MRERPFFIAFLLVSIAPAALFIVAILYVVQYGFRRYIPGSLEMGGFTLANFARIFLEPIYAVVVLDTVLISVLTAVFALVLSYPLAYILVRTRSTWLKTSLLVIAVSPLFAGEVVRSYAWLLVLGTNGFLNSLLLDLGLVSQPIQFLYTRGGVILALVQFMMPVMIILLATAISHIDVTYQKAAANLGATPFRVLWHITLPLSTPGILSGLIVVFAWTMSAFSTPQFIGGGKVMMLSNLVFTQGLLSFNLPLAAVLSIVALVAAIASLILMGLLLRRFEQVSLH
jgi:putative spermidine/putrescine transport system permease protein